MVFIDKTHEDKTGIIQHDRICSEVEIRKTVLSKLLSKLTVSLIFIFMSIILNNNVFAQFTVADYPIVKNQEIFLIYINGVGNGFAWYNSYLDENIRNYCPPDDLQLNINLYINLLDKQLQNANNFKTITLDMPIEMILLNSLQKTYPCNKPIK